MSISNLILFKEISPELTDPGNSDWCLPILRMSNNRDKFKLWQIGYDSKSQKLITKYGLQDGAIQERTAAVKLNTSGRDFGIQALLNAKKKYTDKYSEGYRPLTEEASTTTQPMLAEKWDKTLIPGYSYGVNVKLDGIRCLTRIENGILRKYSRNHKSFDYITHLNNEISVFLKFLPTETTIDGELYIDKQSVDENSAFNKITSIVKADVNLHPLLNTVQYYIYDIDYPDTRFSNSDKNLNNRPPMELRYSQLIEGYKNYLKAGYNNTIFKILQMPIVNSVSEIEAYKSYYIGLGYEGIIIRHLSNNMKNYKYSVYKPNSRTNMMKDKDFEDEEVRITGVKNSEGAETGLAKLDVIDSFGVVYDVRPSFNFETRKLWLKNPELIIGKFATIKHFGKFPDTGKPRFPVLKAIRDYE
jgi:ATP-dependent DNA ligase